MQARTWILALAVAFAATGCATTAPDDSPVTRGAFQGPLRCEGACSVQVWVTQVDGKPTVNVSAPDVQMAQRFRRSVIAWRLVNSPDYEFRADSIRPHTGPPSNGKETTPQGRWDRQMHPLGHLPAVFAVINDNDRREIFYYDVTVYRKDSKESYTLDPAIMNDP